MDWRFTHVLLKISERPAFLHWENIGAFLYLGYDNLWISFCFISMKSVVIIFQVILNLRHDWGFYDGLRDACAFVHSRTVYFRKKPLGINDQKLSKMSPKMGVFQLFQKKRQQLLQKMFLKKNWLCTNSHLWKFFFSWDIVENDAANQIARSFDQLCLHVELCA